MTTDPAFRGRRWLAFLRIGMPALAALAAGLVLLPWILGVPAVKGTDFARGWTIGFWSLVGYLLAYSLTMLLKLLGRVRRIDRLGRLADGIAWFALVCTIVGQVAAWTLIMR